MPEFASCYFCGTALDAQIEPYPVVPEDAAADGRPTVDLCPVCRRKLSKVLDVALSAADGATVAATPLAAGPKPSPLEADHEDPTADVGGDETAENGPAYAVEPSGEATAVEEDLAADTEAEGEDGDEDEDRSTDAAVTGDVDPETVTDQGAGDDPVAEPASEVDGTGPDGDSDPASAESAATEQDDGTTDRPSILSTPAAKKIIKLLQNREFPVEREEIAVVATNAYAIPEGDCADVLDALVSEGYVGERSGKLVRSEE